MLQWSSMHIYLCTHILVGQIPGSQIARSTAKLKPFFGFIAISTFVYCTMCLTLLISRFISINGSQHQRYIRLTWRTLKNYICPSCTPDPLNWNFWKYGSGFRLPGKKSENSNVQQGLRIIDLYIKQDKTEL